MLHDPGETMALAALAKRRYPGVSLLLALDFLRSDRRRADLGSLAARRRGKGSIYRVKREEWTNRITYVMGVDLPARQELGPWEMPDAPGGDWGLVPMKSTVRTLPPRRFELCLPVAPSQFRTQAGRDSVARGLRQLRAEFRRANP